MMTLTIPGLPARPETVLSLDGRFDLACGDVRSRPDYCWFEGLFQIEQTRNPPGCQFIECQRRPADGIGVRSEMDDGNLCRPQIDQHPGLAASIKTLYAANVERAKDSQHTNVRRIDFLTSVDFERKSGASACEVRLERPLRTGQLESRQTTGGSPRDTPVSTRLDGPFLSMDYSNKNIFDRQASPRHTTRIKNLGGRRTLCHRVHAAKQLAYRNGCNTGIDIGHGVGNDQFIVVNHRAAGIHDIGYVPFTLFLMRGEQRLV